MSFNNSAWDWLPCVKEIFQLLGVGIPPIPLVAFPVDFRSNFRLEDRSVVQSHKIPLSTIFLILVSKPSASKGRLPETRCLCGSSLIERFSGKTIDPLLFSSHEVPLATAAPFVADSK